MYQKTENDFLMYEGLTKETFYWSLWGVQKMFYAIEKVQKLYYRALKFRARRRQANQQQVTQALTVIIILQLAPT